MNNGECKQKLIELYMRMNVVINDMNEESVVDMMIKREDYNSLREDLKSIIDNLSV
tara:strand:+ start:781 stop:948 length:168 start_codon:yes stop_codon:yes gene_type:complete